MSRYRAFVTCFILSTIGFIVFMISYFYNIIAMIGTISENQGYGYNPDPQEVMAFLLSPVMLIAIVIGGLAGLAYKILGIVFVAQNKTMESTERVLWIVGFIIAGFVTAIVFMALKQSRNLVPEADNKAL